MEDTINHRSEIHNQLRALIQMKSLRDGHEFSIYQLAKAIGMPHSIIVKLLHPDPSKRVANPRVDTLYKIVDFFKSDGFSITIDNLILGGNEIDLNSILLNSHENTAIEVFSLNNIYNNLGKIDLNVSKKSDGLIALLSDQEIEPFFKSGSVFIIDTATLPKEDNLVAVRTGTSTEVQIYKFIKKNKVSYLSNLTGSETIKFSPVQNHVLGIVIQVNAIT